MGINTADKKPQMVKDPETGKQRVRMVPTDKEVVKTEGGMKRIATTQSNKADRVASTDKKGLETFRKMRQRTNEKKLTPAELKKREKVAKSIERDNPDMPMDKKMAIATDVAKKTAESKVDEILDTPKAMDSYKNKAKASYSKAASSAAAKILRGKDKDGNRADHRPELKTMAKRKKGMTAADMVAVRRTFDKLRGPK